MAVAAADFYTYSKATGTPLPKSKQEEAQLAPAVNQWKKSRTKAPESIENQNDIGDNVGKGLIGAALAGAALYGYRRGWGESPKRTPDSPSPTLPNVDEVTGLADTTFIPSPITPKDSRGVNLVGTRNPKTGTYRASVNEIRDQPQATTVVPEVRQQPQVTPEEALDSYRQKWINEHSTSKATIGDIQEGIRQKKLATGDKEISPGFFESDARRQEQEIARRGFNETDLPPPQDQPAPGAPSPDDPAFYSRKYIESTGAIEPTKVVEVVPETLVQKQQQPSVTTQVADQSFGGATGGYEQLDDAFDRSVQRDIESVATSPQAVERQLKIKAIQEQRLANLKALNDPNTKQALDLYAQTGDPEVLKLLSDQPSLPVQVRTSGGTQDTRQYFDKTTRGEWIEDLEDKDINLTNKINSLRQEQQEIADYNEFRRAQIDEDQNIARYAMDNASTQSDENIFLRNFAKLQNEKDNLQNPNDLNVDIGDAIEDRNQVRREIASNKELGATYKLNVEKQSRPFYELDPEGNIISETVELRGERPIITTEEKRGGGRLSAQATSPAADPLDDLVIQNQQLSSAERQTRNVQDLIDNSGKKFGNLVDTKGLELDQRQYANESSSGSVIGPYGIEKQDRPQAITSIAPSASPGSWTPAAGRARSENVNIVISGGRDYTNYPEFVQKTDQIIREMNIPANKKITIVEGGAKGADKLAERYARERGYGLVVKPADWSKGGTLKYPEYDKSAGPRRNREMAEMGDVGIAFPGGKGTSDLVKTMARETGKPVYYASEIQQPTAAMRGKSGTRVVNIAENVRHLSDPNWLASQGYNLNRTSPETLVGQYLGRLGVKRTPATNVQITDEGVGLSGQPRYKKYEDPRVIEKRERIAANTERANIVQPAPQPNYPAAQNQVTYVPANPKSLSITSSEIEKAQQAHLLNYISAAHGQIKGGARVGGTKMRNKLTPYTEPSDAMIHQLVMKRREERI